MDLASLSADVKRGQVDRHLEFLDDKIKKMKMGLQVDFSIIASVLTAWTMLLEDQNIPIDTTLLKKCILLLRVACVQGSSVQTQILHHDHCLKNIQASTSHPDDTVTRSTWQLCSNLLVQCPENVEKAITDLLPLCLSNLEVATKDVDVIAAVIYNLLEANKLLGSPVELSKFEIYKGALDAIYRHPEEQFTFLQFLLEQFLTGDAEPKEAYLALGRDRIKLHHYVTEYVKSDVHELSSPFLRVLSESYNRLADNILTWFNGHVSTAEPEELLSLLECLSTITGTPKYSLAYKSEASIFINSGGLLVACCESQKSEVAAKDKLSDFQVTGEKEEDRFFDFKTLLIRLIGNLAHKNKKNQDYARDLKILLTICGCTKIDARNPLMKEWSILAIRNLLENNPENQKLIHQLTQQGRVDSEVLKEYQPENGLLRLKK